MWQLTDLQNPDAPAPRYQDLRDASRAHRRAHPASRFAVRWVGAGPMPLETPIMGWQSCRYVYDGTDVEDGDYYRCTTHDCLTLGHEVSCEKAGDA